MEGFGEQSPMGHAAEPDEIAPSYIFFASNRLSSYYTGQNLVPRRRRDPPGIVGAGISWADYLKAIYAARHASLAWPRGPEAIETIDDLHVHSGEFLGPGRAADWIPCRSSSAQRAQRYRLYRWRLASRTPSHPA
jgi:hypothetical protein